MVLVQHARHSRAARPKPDIARIFGMAGAIALNVALLMLLLVPITQPVLAPVDDTIRTTLEQIDRTKKPKPVEAPVVKRQERTTAPTIPRPVEQKPLPQEAVVDQGELPAIVPAETLDLGVETEIVSAISGPVAGVRLEYARAPAPGYPIDAKRKNEQGLVLLKILVDVDGRPLEVTIEKSSGHRRLDDAARRHVLKYWMFRPAMKDGRAVQAIGIVPIDFNLQL